MPNFNPKPNLESRLQVIAPDTLYVAAAERNRLYFIDTRFDAKIAAHIKQQNEWASVHGPNIYIHIDEIAIMAEMESACRSEVPFTFDPAYARVTFTAGINRKSPDIKLPKQTEVAGHVVAYDIGESLQKTPPLQGLWMLEQSELPK